MQSEAHSLNCGKRGACARTSNLRPCPGAACAAPPSRCACGKPARFVVDARGPWGRFLGHAEPCCSECTYLARRGYRVRVRPLEELAAVCGEGRESPAPVGPVRYVAGGAACLVSHRRRRASEALELLELVDGRELVFVEVAASADASRSPSSPRLMHILPAGATTSALCGRPRPFQFSAVKSLDLLCLQCAKVLRAQSRKGVK